MEKKGTAQSEGATFVEKPYGNYLQECDIDLIIPQKSF